MKQKMSKSYQSKSGYRSPKQTGTPGRFKDRDIAGTDPNKEQFAPTDAEPIRQHARMAGDPISDYVMGAVAGKAARKSIADADAAVRKPEEKKESPFAANTKRERELTK